MCSSDLTQTNFMSGRIISLLSSAQSPSRHVMCLPASFQARSLLHVGGISTLRNSVRELQSTLFDVGRMPKELFLAHLTCPRCAATRGGEKILLLRRWTDSARLKHSQRPDPLALKSGNAPSTARRKIFDDCVTDESHASALEWLAQHFKTTCYINIAC